MSDKSNVCPVSSSVISEVLRQENSTALGLTTAMQWDHGGVESQRLSFGSLRSTPVLPTCSPIPED